MEQKQYINNCILRLRKKKKIGSMKINKKRKNQKIRLMTIHKQQNNKMPKLEKFLKIFSRKKVTLSLKYYNKTMCLYHQYQKKIKTLLMSLIILYLLSDISLWDYWNSFNDLKESVIVVLNDHVIDRHNRERLKRLTNIVSRTPIVST